MYVVALVDQIYGPEHALLRLRLPNTMSCFVLHNHAEVTTSKGIGLCNTEGI